MFQNLTEWKNVCAEAEQLKSTTLRQLFAEDANRANDMTVEAAGLTLDYSKNLVSRKMMQDLFAMARACKLDEAIKAMFSGERINVTENRPVLHIALRNRSNTPIYVDGKDVMPDVNEVLEKMADFAERVRSGEWKGYTGKKIKNIINIGIGGSDWATAIEYDHTQLAMSPMWKIIDNEKFAWSKNIIMEDEKVERVREIGRNLVRAAADYENAKYMGDPGVCPHCHSKNFYVTPGTTEATCMTCGIVGKLDVVDGAIQFSFTEEAATHAHDTLSGKFMHAGDIKENEGQAIANRSSDKFKASQARINSYNIPEILPPSKRA
jgi:hypothetical protein